MTYLKKLERVLPKADIVQLRDTMCPGELFGKPAPTGYEDDCPYTNTPTKQCRNECWEWECKEADNVKRSDFMNEFKVFDWAHKCRLEDLKHGQYFKHYDRLYIKNNTNLVDIPALDNQCKGCVCATNIETGELCFISFAEWVEPLTIKAQIYYKLDGEAKQVTE